MRQSIEYSKFKMNISIAWVFKFWAFKDFFSTLEAFTEIFSFRFSINVRIVNGIHCVCTMYLIWWWSVTSSFRNNVTVKTFPISLRIDFHSSNFSFGNFNVAFKNRSMKKENHKTWKHITFSPLTMLHSYVMAIV